MKKFLSMFLALALVFSVTASAEENSSSPSDTPNVKPEFPVSVGNTTIKEKPVRVAAISPAATDIIKGLGFENRIVAVGNGSSGPVFPDLKDDYPIYQIGTLMAPDLEAIKKASPDVLFSHAPFTDNNRKKIEQMGITIVEIPFAESFDEVFENYRLVCKVMLGENKGAQYSEKKIARYKELLKKVADISAKHSEEKTAVYMDMFPKTLATGETFQNMILKEILAFENPAEESKNWILSDEKMKELNPDKIFYNYTIDPEEIKTYVSYSTTTAVTEEQLYALKGKFFQSRSPQMFMNLVSLMYKLYPEDMPADLSEL